MTRVDDSVNQTSQQSVDLLGRRAATVGGAGRVIGVDGLTVAMQSVDILGRRGLDSGVDLSFDSTTYTFDTTALTFDAVSL